MIKKIKGGHVRYSAHIHKCVFVCMCVYTIAFEVYTVLVYFAFLNPDVV